MKTIIFISICLCLVVSTISAEKSTHNKHDNKKLLKSGGHEQQQQQLKEAVAAHKSEHSSKSPLPLKEDLPAEQKPVREGRKHHRHGKNRKGGQHAGEAHQQSGRSRKSHSKPKTNQNGPSKTHHNKHGRKQGRGKQVQQ
ncbi:uncharacterized protein LOC106083732 [Stomoxys calcitrans]|uniref:Uncharacterized protein n=1 Tax=Stomoxys calcitrans TaxID=35570 RepID=A0A1I8PNT2_STOCA|nr:uncharacterized protein LOC106083732 [Stomoxys calcitrans]